MKYRVIKNYHEPVTDPIAVKKGENLKCIRESDPSGDWANWVFCRGLSGEGWVPKQILEGTGTERIALDNYIAREHHLVQGEVLVANKELNGWVWSYKESKPDFLAWAPMNCLERIVSHE